MSGQSVSAASVDAVGVPREAISAALPSLQLADDEPGAAGGADAVLSTFARTVSPVLDELAATAAAQPGGSVAAALTQLRRARIALDRHRLR